LLLFLLLQVDVALSLLVHCQLLLLLLLLWRLRMVHPSILAIARRSIWWPRLQPLLNHGSVADMLVTASC
jgi:hypothetical protein